MQTIAPPSASHRQQLLREKINPFEVHEEETVEILLGRPVERRGAVDSGVVDQEIEVLSLPCRFERLPDGVGKFFKPAEVGNIDLEERRFAPVLLDLRGDGFAFLLSLAIREDHVGAVFGKRERDVASKAPASAGDQCDFVF